MPALGYVGVGWEPIPEKETTKIEAHKNSPLQASVVDEIRRKPQCQAGRLARERSSWLRNIRLISACCQDRVQAAESRSWMWQHFTMVPSLPVDGSDPSLGGQRVTGRLLPAERSNSSPFLPSYRGWSRARTLWQINFRWKKVPFADSHRYLHSRMSWRSSQSRN
jgi:hypothetical protein